MKSMKEITAHLSQNNELNEQIQLARLCISLYKVCTQDILGLISHRLKAQTSFKLLNTVKILNIGTCMSEQTV